MKCVLWTPEGGLNRAAARPWCRQRSAAAPVRVRDQAALDPNDRNKSSAQSCVTRCQSGRSDRNYEIKLVLSLIGQSLASHEVRTQ